MKDSSRWLLIIAMFALLVAITQHSGGWLFFGIGSKPASLLLLVAFAIWMMRGRGCCDWNTWDEDEEAEEESDES